MWRWHRDSMQMSARTVSRARALPCSPLRSAERASHSGPQGGQSREAGAGAEGPHLSPQWELGLEQEAAV